VGLNLASLFQIGHYALSRPDTRRRWEWHLDYNDPGFPSSAKWVRAFLWTSRTQVVLASRPRTTSVHVNELKLDTVWVSKVEYLDAYTGNGSDCGMSDAVFV
jgi:hypothetical protein